MDRYKYHIVQFSDISYGLQHPEECLPNLLDCAYDMYLRECEEPDKRPGRYGMKMLPPIDDMSAVAYWELVNDPSRA